MSAAVAGRPEIGDRLPRDERDVGNLGERGVPEAHGAIPQPWMLVEEGRHAAEHFLGYEGSLGCHERRQIERLPIDVANRAGDLDGVAIERLMKQLADA